MANGVRLGQVQAFVMQHGYAAAVMGDVVVWYCDGYKRCEARTVQEAKWLLGY